MPVDWTTPKMLKYRVNLLAEDLVYNVYTKCIQYYSKTPQVKKLLKGFRWKAVRNFLTPPCPLCDARDRKSKIYLAGQFMPRLPAHFNCRCSWQVVLR